MRQRETYPDAAETLTRPLSREPGSGVCCWRPLLTTWTFALRPVPSGDESSSTFICMIP